MIWFTSDFHFGHEKDFLWKPRGFSNWEEHAEQVITRYNEVVDDVDSTIGELTDVSETAIEDEIKLLKDAKGGDQINLTNPKYLLADAVANGTLYEPKEEDYADQSMIDNDDFYGSVMDNLQADIDGINEGKFSKTKEKTEKKENNEPQQASENNSQGSSEGGQG